MRIFLSSLPTRSQSVQPPLNIGPETALAQDHSFYQRSKTYIFNLLDNDYDLRMTKQVQHNMPTHQPIYFNQAKLIFSTCQSTLTRPFLICQKSS